MTNTANIRFEPSNVAYVAVDLDTHEMSGGVMDETTGTFYPVGGGGGGDSPIRCCKVNVTNNDETKTLYADHYGDGYALRSYMGSGDMVGSMFMYIPSADGLANGGDYKTNGVIAGPGETGEMYLINSCWSKLVGGEWVLQYFLGALSKSATNITYEAVDNVSVTEDSDYYYFALTDNTKDGELNLTATS